MNIKTGCEPKKYEREDEFISRCISIESDHHPEMEHEAIIAMCFTRWRKDKGIPEPKKKSAYVKF